MPWGKRKVGKKWEVYNKDTGESKGKSDSERMANRHLAALYANSPEARRPSRKKK